MKCQRTLRKELSSSPLASTSSSALTKSQSTGARRERSSSRAFRSLSKAIPPPSREPISHSLIFKRKLLRPLPAHPTQTPSQDQRLRLKNQSLRKLLSKSQRRSLKSSQSKNQLNLNLQNPS